MKDDIFILGKIPGEFFLNYNGKVIYWHSLFNGNYPIREYLKTAESEPFPRNSSFLVRTILGFLSGFNGNILFTTPGSHSEHKTLLSLFHMRGKKICELKFDHSFNYKNLDYMSSSLNLEFSLPPIDMIQNFNILKAYRKKIHDYAISNKLTGIQLHNLALKLSEGKIPNFTLSTPQKGKKIALIGSPITPKIIEWIENRGFLVSLTQDTIYEFLLIDEEHSLYQNFPFPMTGVKKWAKLAETIMKKFKIDGYLYLMVPLSHELLEYKLFSQNISLPSLGIELLSPFEIDKRTGLRIDSFLEVLSKK